MIPWLQWYMYFLQERTSLCTFFNLLQEHMPFTPTRAFADFKVAVHNAIRLVIQGITIEGCVFQCVQCAQTIWLQYYTEKTRRSEFPRAAVLPLMTAYKTFWFHALEDLKDATWPPALYKLHIQEQWIEGHRLVWNHFGSEGPRTTNNIEAVHGKMKRNFQHIHPNIFTIIQTYKEIQISNDINII